jgi:hypothetical protein
MTGAITHDAQDDIQRPEADGPDQDAGPDAPRG